MSTLKNYKQTLQSSPAPNIQVLLTVIVGNAQIGASKISFEDDIDNIIAKGDIENFKLGKGKDLKGRILIIKTTVLDSNANSNKIVITNQLTQTDNMILDETFTEKVENEKDGIRLTTSMKFL